MGNLKNNLSFYNPFENKAWEYDTWYDTHHELFTRQLELIRPFLKNEKGVILEIGCGPGRFSSALGIPYGIEPSRASGRMAYQRGIGIIQGIGEFLPIRSRCLSQVFLITVLGFVREPAHILKEIHRCLLLSGSLILVEIDMECEIGEKYLKTRTKSTFFSCADFFSNTELLSLLKKTGFRVSLSRRSAGLVLVSAYQNK